MPILHKSRQAQRLYRHMRHPGAWCFLVILWVHPLMTLGRSVHCVPLLTVSKQHAQLDLIRAGEDFFLGLNTSLRKTCATFHSLVDSCFGRFMLTYPRRHFWDSGLSIESGLQSLGLSGSQKCLLGSVKMLALYLSKGIKPTLDKIMLNRGCSQIIVNY